MASLPHKHHQVESPLRLAIVSTPRSGNAWLRHLLQSVYAMPTMAVHNPTEVDWPSLPARCAMQIHWYPTSSILTELERAQFQVLTVARHPLDVLLSILHFVLHDASSDRWLESEHGNERQIYGAMPCSSAFLDYATGKRAGALLAVSREWWLRPGVWPLRYEELVRDPQGMLEQLVQRLGVPTSCPLDEAISAHSLARRRQTDRCHDYHYWQGKPGLWKHLLPASQAQPIGDALHAHFQALGYACDPDPELDMRQADANWIQLVWEDLAHDLQHIKATYESLDRLRIDLGTRQSELQALQEALTAARAEAAAVLEQLGTTRAQLARYEDLGPLAIAAARRLKRLGLRLPRLAAVVRRVARPWLRPTE